MRTTARVGGRKGDGSAVEAAKRRIDVDVRTMAEWRVEAAARELALLDFLRAAVAAMTDPSAREETAGETAHAVLAAIR